ncbi:hypothetical protein, partial [Mesorhizobium sp. M2A.F.Ca.ET.015.02.1.1]|uniref:hypothetical protein n=1 Tax=Mesorhizobium sp. M2A.F.Ca.ET.015.02.1.1 TaxID=2496758 RepID=UPI001AECF461
TNPSGAAIATVAGSTQDRITLLMDDTRHDRVYSWDLIDHGEDWLMLRHWRWLSRLPCYSA